MSILRRVVLVAANLLAVAALSGTVSTSVPTPLDSEFRMAYARPPVAGEAIAFSPPRPPPPGVRSLFDPPVRLPGARLSDVAVDPPPPLRLLGVVAGPVRVALVGGDADASARRLRIGDTMDGWTLIDIGPKSIELTRAGARRLLPLDRVSEAQEQ